MRTDLWIVECDDLFGRGRSVTVLRHSGRVVVATPPGQAAVFTTAALDQLIHALTAATARGDQTGPTDPGSPSNGTTGVPPAEL